MEREKCFGYCNYCESTLIYRFDDGTVGCSYCGSTEKEVCEIYEDEYGRSIQNESK